MNMKKLVLGCAVICSGIFAVNKLRAVDNEAEIQNMLFQMIVDNKYAEVKKIINAHPDVLTKRFDHWSRFYDGAGSLPVNVAAYQGSPETLKLIIEKSPETIDAVSGEVGITPLTQAIVLSQQSDQDKWAKAKILVDNGADMKLVKNVDKHGTKLLHDDVFAKIIKKLETLKKR